MAYYWEPDCLKKSKHRKAFEREYMPGEKVKYSGIYVCVGCGREVVYKKGDPLTTQNRHQHDPSQGPIVWKLIVKTRPSRTK